MFPKVPAGWDQMVLRGCSRGFLSTVIQGQSIGQLDQIIQVPDFLQEKKKSYPAMAVFAIV